MIQFLIFTLLAVLVQGLFAFFEMACVSFNKVRLQYYVSTKVKRALWLNYLLRRPSRLFGTTLIGINTALVIGAECSRKFYESIHVDPDWAPLSQIFIVVIFAELAPMFAARRSPEQAAMFCVPIMVFISKVFSPIIWSFDAFSRLIHKAIGNAKEAPLFLSREEVKMAFEEREEGEDPFNTTVSRIFQLKNLTSGELMIPLDQVQMAPSHTTLSELRHLLSVHYSPLIPIYHRTRQNIVAIAHLRDYLGLSGEKRILDSARSAWFITRDLSVLHALEQFRRNNQSLAVILDSSGHPCGVLSLDQIFSQIFGQEEALEVLEEIPNYIERTLSGDMTVAAFNLQFEASLPDKEDATLSDLLIEHLDHAPVKDETVRIADFEFTIKEITLRGVKTLTVRNCQRQE